MMTVKEAIKFLISFGGHTFLIIAYLLQLSTFFDFIYVLKSMPEIEEKSNYVKLEFTFKKRSIDITPRKDMCLPVGKTTVFYFEMVKRPSNLTDGPVVLKMKPQRDTYSPQT